MTKRISAKHKISRRLGVALWGEAKDPFHRKNYRPGQHGPLRTSGGRASDYGKQLLAKQRLKGYYGEISERQMTRIYREAERRKGDTGENMIRLLETRLATVVYRLNFVPTIFAARQFVNHGHVCVNGKPVNIPSYHVKPGDVITVRDRAKQMGVVQESLQKMTREVPPYLSLDADAYSGTVSQWPDFKDVPYPVHMEPHLVVEYYSYQA